MTSKNCPAGTADSSPHSDLHPLPEDSDFPEIQDGRAIPGQPRHGLYAMSFYRNKIYPVYSFRMLLLLLLYSILPKKSTAANILLGKMILLNVFFKSIFVVF